MSSLTVIFDMDGVILDSERVYQEIEKNMYEELGIPVDREEHMRFMGTAERSMWTYMHDKYRLSVSVEELVLEERKRFFERLKEAGDIPLMQGIIPLLKGLNSERIPCWVASSSSSDIIARVIRINGLEKYYQGYVSGDDVSQSKPSPEIFLKAAELAQTDPARCVVIEDSENGVRAAIAAGMKVIGLNQDEPFEEKTNHRLSSAELIISNLNEIKPVDINGLLA